MNNAVKSDKVLAELKYNIENDGMPPTEDFPSLCDYVTDWMLRRYNLDGDYEINQGYCFIWAYLVWALWPHGGVTFKTVTQHVIVVYKGEHFDATNTSGHDDVGHFVCFGGLRTPKHTDVESMAWFWARSGKQYREFRRLIRKFTPSMYRKVRDNGSHYWRDHWSFYGSEHIGNLPSVTA
jgi:hypothetical protein